MRDLSITTVDDLQYLEEIAYSRGALVQYARLTGAEARISIVGDKAVITIADSISNRHRQRFNIAHELGHFELHRRRRPRSSCTSADLGSWSDKETSRDPEREANTFAAALLLPEAFFAALCDEADPSLDRVSELAARFNVSLTATALRYIHFSPEPCVVILSEGDRATWAIPNAAFRELGVYIESRVRLDSSSLAHRAFQKKNSRVVGKVRLDTWAAPGQYDPDALVREESWYSEDFGSVLTLLWANEDIYDDDLWEL